MCRPTPPTQLTRDRPNYNRSLKRRASLAFSLDPATTRLAAPTGKRGRWRGRGDAAIQACPMMNVL